MNTDSTIHRRYIRTRYLFVAGAGLLTAFGAQAGNELTEISVTASKRQTRLGDYDGQVAVIGEAMLERRGIEAIDDLGTSVGGLVFRQRGNKAYDNITLRGQSSIDFYNPKVQVYVDGFIQDQATFSLLMPNGIEQVEVLYGPQGSLYGRGAVGGVLDVVTRSPFDSAPLSLSAGFDNLTREFALSAGGEFGGGWAADIGGIRRDRDGEYRGQLSGEALGNRDDENLRLRLAYRESGSPWEFSLQYSGSDVESGEEQYVQAAMVRNRIAFPVPNHYTLQSDHYGMKLGYDFGSLQLDSLSSYQQRELDRTVFGSYTPETQDTFTQELRLSSTGDGPVAFTAGLYYESIDFAYLRPAYTMESLQDIRSLSLFGELNWALGERWNLGLGLRAEEREVRARGIFGAFAVAGEEDFSRVSPKISLGYSLSENSRLYALFSTGYKPGGFTQLVTPAIASFSYGAEDVDNLELGFRSSFWRDRALLSLAAYFTGNDNFQLFVGIQPDQYLQNIGAAESRGLDANLQLFPSENFSINLSYAWNRAEFTEYSNPAMPGLDYSGNDLPHTPRHSLNLGFSYELALPGGLGSLNPGFAISHVSEMFFDETNTIGEDAVTLYSLNLAWHIDERLRISAYAENLSNETYRVYGFDGGPSLGGVFYQLGQGATAGLRFRAEL